MNSSVNHQNTSLHFLCVYGFCLKIESQLKDSLQQNQNHQIHRVLLFIFRTLVCGIVQIITLDLRKTMYCSNRPSDEEADRGTPLCYTVLDSESNVAYFTESKYGLSTPVTSMHQHGMYPHHPRPPGMPPTGPKSMPPGYNEPPTLSHLSATHPPPPQTSSTLPLPTSQMNPQLPLSPNHLR